MLKLERIRDIGGTPVQRGEIKRGGLTGRMGKREREIPYSIQQTLTNKSMSTTMSNM